MMASVRRDLPDGTVTFLFTDVEGSTRLLHELGAEGYVAALAEHRRLVREAFAAHAGVEVDTQGDVSDELGLTPEIRLVNVSDAADAERLRFLGSPTIRVDGRDVEPGADERETSSRSPAASTRTARVWCSGGATRTRRARRAPLLASRRRPARGAQRDHLPTQARPEFDRNRPAKENPSRRSSISGVARPHSRLGYTVGALDGSPMPV
jgi:hypothetical protein